MKRLLLLLLGLAVAAGSFGQAKISDLPDASTLAGGEFLPVVQSGVTKKVTVNNVRSNIYKGTSPTTVTVGGLAIGSVIFGNTYDAIIQSIVAPYINPVFNSFAVSQSQTVEVKTTLSGAKTFTWSTTNNSGVVSTITIVDNTTGTNLAVNTTNDGTESITINTKILTTDGATQSWKAIGNNTSPTGTFNSGNYDVTARYYLWYGAVSTVPTTSAGIRALANNQFYYGSTSFTLLTGTLKDFMVALPPGKSITSVVDLDALNANLTSQYIAQTAINVVLPDATTASYPIYKMTIASAYSSSHRHQITIN